MNSVSPPGRFKAVSGVVGRVALVVLAVAYPLAIYAGLTLWNTHVVAVVLGTMVLVLALVRLRRADKATRRAVLVPPLAVGALIGLAMAFDDARFILATPVLINGALLATFGASLRTEVPMIEHYARLQRPDLSPAECAHCRQATVAWCVFFAVNGGVAGGLALWAPLGWWTLYTGIISYVLMGLLFAAEFVVRRARFGGYGLDPEVLRPLARHGPDDAVAWTSAGPRTRRQCLADVHTLALALPSAQPGRPLVLICADRYRFAVALLAAWQAGHRVVLPPNGQAETVERVAVQSEALVVLHDTEQAPAQVPHLRVHQLLGAAASTPGEPLRAISLHTVVVTAFTSGSSGAFQPVAKTAGQLFSEVACLARTLDVRPGHRILATVPPHHIYGLLFGLLLPLCTGAALSDDTPLHAETVAARIAALGATHLVTVPAHLRGLEMIEAGRLAGLQALISSTAPLPPRVAAMVQRRHGLAVTEVLGSTETGGIAWRRGADTLWQPLAGVGVHADEQGRLHVRSPFLDPAWAQPSPTEDRVAFEGSGFRHLGRLDGVVKVGGKRLALAHLEARLVALPGVKDAAALALQSGGARGVQVWAAVVAPGLTSAAIRAELGRWFEPAQLPRRIRNVAALPREATGKLRRARLLELFSLRDGPAAAQPAPERLVVLAHDGPTLVADGSVERHLFRLAIPQGFARFDGHFPDMAVLPGISTLQDAVMAQVVALHPELGQPSRLRNLKFHRVVGPGAELELRLDFRERRVDFRLAEGGESTASGRLLFEDRS